MYMYINTIYIFFLFSQCALKITAKIMQHRIRITVDCDAFLLFLELPKRESLESTRQFHFRMKKCRSLYIHIIYIYICICLNMILILYKYLFVGGAALPIS